MADTRTVVLILSPRAAEAVENGLTEARIAIGFEYAQGDPDAIEYGGLLENVRDELAAQRANLEPSTAERIAEQMAKAGAEAVAL